MAAKPRMPFGDPTDYLTPKPYKKKLNFGKRSSYDPDEESRDIAENNRKVRERRAKAKESAEYVPLSPGDPEHIIAKYLPSTPVSAAHAEKVTVDARDTAKKLLETHGYALPEDERKILEKFVHDNRGGFQEGDGNALQKLAQSKTGGLFFNLIDFIDTPMELIRTGVADVTGVDERTAGVELGFADYWNVLWSDQASLVERHGEEAAGKLGLDTDFGVQGETMLLDWRLEGQTHDNDFTRFLDNFDHGNDEDFDPRIVDRESFEKFATHRQKQEVGYGGLIVDVALDPATYMSWGTLAVGKKAAIEAAVSTAIEGGKRVTSVGVKKLGKLAAEEAAAGVVSKGGWRGGIKHLYNGGSKDDLTGVARHAAEKVEERVAKEIGQRTDDLLEELAAVRGHSQPGHITAREADDIADAAKRSIIAEELRAVENFAHLPYSTVSEGLERLAKLKDRVVMDTAFGQEISDLVKLQAEKRYQDLFDLFPAYRDELPKWATGGIKVGFLPGARSMPAFDTGLRLNGPGQRVAKAVFGVLPGDGLGWIGKQHAMFSKGRRLIDSARDYEIGGAKAVSPYFSDRTVRNAVQLSGAGVKLGKASDALIGEFHKIQSLGPEVNRSKDEAGELAMKMLNDGTGATFDDLVKEVGMETASAFREGVEGVGEVLQTMHGLAQSVGMRIGEVENFIPLVAESKYSDLIVKLAEDGVAISLDGVADAEARLGLEILSQYVGSVNGGGRAVKSLGDSVHARSRIRTAGHESSTGGVHGTMVLDRTQISDALGTARLNHYDHATLNRSVSKALKVLGDRGLVSAKTVKKIGDKPFETDMARILNSYMDSMTASIELRTANQLFSQAGLVSARPTRVSITRTLKHVNEAVNSGSHPVMTFLDDLAEAIEEGAVAAVDAKASARKTVNVLKGWDIEVPAAIVGTKPFDNAVKQLRSTYNKVARNINSAQREVHGHVDDLVAKGVPREVAVRTAAVGSVQELADVLSDLRRIGDEQATELMVLAGEQVAANAHKLPDKVLAAQLAAGAEEAVKIRAGVQETIASIEKKLAKDFKIPGVPENELRVTDLGAAAAPDGSDRTFLQWLGDKGQERLDSAGHKWTPLEDLSEEQLANVYSNPQVAARSAEALVERVDGVKMTVNDVVEFSDPSRAAQTLRPLAAKLEAAGFPVDDFMSPELRSAVDDVATAEEFLRDVRNGFEAATIKEAKQVVFEAKANLVGLSEELVNSDVLLADVIAQVSDTIVDVFEDPLFSSSFLDVWAVSLHGLGKMSKSEMAAEMAAQGIKSVGQTELFRQNSKELMRDRALTVIRAYQESVYASLDVRGFQSLAEFSPSNVERAVRALRSGDREVLRGMETELDAILKTVWPNMEGSIKVRPDGAIVFESVAESPVWVTMDEVLPELRKIVPDSENMSLSDLLGIGATAWRADPGAVEGASETLSKFFRTMDEGGGLDWDAETYEWLVSFNSNLKGAAAGLRGKAKRAGAKPTAAELRRVEAASALDEVLEAVDIVSGGTGRVAAVGGRFSDEIEDFIAKNPDGVVYHGSYALTPGKLKELLSNEDAFNRGGLTRSRSRAERYAREARPSGASGVVDGGEPVVLAFKVSDLPPTVQKAIRRGEDVEELFPSGNPFDFDAVRPVGSYKITAEGSQAVKTVSRTIKGGVGPKRLTQIWEKNANTILKGMPVDVADRTRSLVEHTIALREAKVPKRILDKQLALRGHLWEPLDEATAKFADDVADIASEAAATSNESLAAAADAMRTFQAELERLNRFGDDFLPGVREGAEGLASDDSGFLGQLGVTQASGRRATTALGGLDPEELKLIESMRGPVDGSPKSLAKWVRQTSERVEAWKPITVPVAELDGYIELSLKGVGGAVFEGKLAQKHAARYLEEMAGHVAALNTEEGAKQLARHVRGVESWWRSAVTVARPGFVPRNLIGGAFNNIMAGVGLTHYAYNLKHIMPAVYRVRHSKMTWEQVIAEAPAHAKAYLKGIQVTDALELGFAASSLHNLQQSVKLADRLKPWSSKNAVFKVGGEVMQGSEDFLRGAAFIANFDPTRPATMWDAKAMTLMAHFDYNNLTPSETRIKTFVPFFTWTKNNIPLQLRTMWERPGILSMYRHIGDGVEFTFGGEEDGFAGNKYNSGLAMDAKGLLTLGEGSAFWAQLVFNPDLPFRDIEELFDAVGEGPGATAGWAIQSLSPVYTAPLDLALGDDNYDVNAPTALAPIVRFLDKFTPMDHVTSEDGTVQISRNAASLFNTVIPMAGEYSELLGGVPANPASANRLGYDVTDGVDFGERARGAALRALRPLGLTFDVPADQKNLVNDFMYDYVYPTKENLALTGEAVHPDDYEALIEALELRGITTP